MAAIRWAFQEKGRVLTADLDCEGEPGFHKVGPLCIPNSPSKNSFAAYLEVGCRKGDSWSFRGAWFPSTEDYTTDPFVCGSLLIESVQEKYKSPITEIIVRDSNTGKQLSKTQSPNTNRLFCLTDPNLVLTSAGITYTLPDLKRSNQVHCNKNESIIAIRKSADGLICLTDKGFLGKLTKNVGK